MATERVHAAFEITPVRHSSGPPHPLANPTRWPALVGVGAMVLGQFLRWGWYVYPGGEVRSIGEIAQGSDGFIATLLGLALLIVLASRSAADSGFRTLQLLPLALGGFCLVEALLGYRNAGMEVAAWRNDGRADFDVGMWLTLGGAGLAAVGGATTTLVLTRNPLHRDSVGLGAGIGLMTDVVVGALGVCAGVALCVLIGAIGGLAIPAILLGPAVAISLWHGVRRRIETRAPAKTD